MSSTHLFQLVKTNMFVVVIRFFLSLFFLGTAVLRYFWIGKTLSGSKILYMMGVMVGLSMVPLYEGLTFHEVQ